MVSPIVAGDVAAVLLGLYVLSSYFSPRRPDLPPGPKPLPLVGNLFDLPKGPPWLHWDKFRKLYGPISSVTVLGRPLIILNDREVAVDLLEKSAAKYSDRPRLAFSEMCVLFFIFTQTLEI